MIAKDPERIMPRQISAVAKATQLRDPVRAAILYPYNIKHVDRNPVPSTPYPWHSLHSGPNAHSFTDTCDRYPSMQ
jgi:hypothetical protein